MIAGAVFIAKEKRNKKGGKGEEAMGEWKNEGDLNCQKGLDCFTSYMDFHIKTYNPWGFKERTFSIFPNHHGNVSHVVKLWVAKHHM